MKLTLRTTLLENWYTIEHAEHANKHWMERVASPLGHLTRLCYSGRISDADVEGTREEMLAIAEAIEKRSSAHFRRCAVDASTDSVAFWSPRNSSEPGCVTREEADALAAQIRHKLAPEAT